jgi:hypothetical protein
MLEQAVDRNLRILGAFYRWSIYAEIQATVERQSELPLSLMYWLVLYTFN